MTVNIIRFEVEGKDHTLHVFPEVIPLQAMGRPNGEWDIVMEMAIALSIAADQRIALEEIL